MFCKNKLLIRVFFELVLIFSVSVFVSYFFGSEEVKAFLVKNSIDERSYLECAGRTANKLYILPAFDESSPWEIAIKNALKEEFFSETGDEFECVASPKYKSWNEDSLGESVCPIGRRAIKEPSDPNCVTNCPEVLKCVLIEDQNCKNSDEFSWLVPGTKDGRLCIVEKDRTDGKPICYVPKARENLAGASVIFNNNIPFCGLGEKCGGEKTGVGFGGDVCASLSSVVATSGSCKKHKDCWSPVQPSLSKCCNIEEGTCSKPIEDCNLYPENGECPPGYSIKKNSEISMGGGGARDVCVDDIQNTVCRKEVSASPRLCNKAEQCIKNIPVGEKDSKGNSITVLNKNNCTVDCKDIKAFFPEMKQDEYINCANTTVRTKNNGDIKAEKMCYYDCAPGKENAELNIPSVASLNKLGDITVQGLIGNVIKIAMGIIGSIALVMFVYGGILWMTALGNSENQKKAMQIMVWTSLGIVVILASWVVTEFVFEAFR